MIIGFTGTRNPLTPQQIAWLNTVLETQPPNVLHHGACIGADSTAHFAALDNDIPVVVHPPTNAKHIDMECLAPHPLVTVLPREPYLNRNRSIVGACDGLVALPSRAEAQEGGTWYTVHFAERMNKPVVICYPDGRIEIRHAATKMQGRQ